MSYMFHSRSMDREASADSQMPLIGNFDAASRKTWCYNPQTYVLRVLLLSLAVGITIFSFLSSETLQGIASSQGILAYTHLLASGTRHYTPSAVDLPPSLSNLPPRLRRIQFISIWSSDDRASYLNNFFRSAALNEAVADFLVIHITDNPQNCLDGNNEFSKNDGILRDSHWDWQNGGNIRVVCLTKEAVRSIEANYLCGESGWKCSQDQYKAVLERLHVRKDAVNCDFKPLRGQMFSQYFIRPGNPLWAWTDMDLHLGRLEHLPFSLLATVDILSFSSFTPSLLYMAGQMTLFNGASATLNQAWKAYTPLSTPERFVAGGPPSEGGFPEGGNEESWLSAAYLQQGPGFAGQNLSWAIVPDVHGQDIFIPGRKFVVSGTNVLEVDAQLDRKEIEAILSDASNETVDETAGWSNDGSELQIDMKTGKACETAWFDKNAAQCIDVNDLTAGNQFTQIDSVRRGTVLHIASDKPGQLHLRMESDRRPRRWQRKLFLHYQEIKRQTWWWALPSYFIGDNEEVMEFDWRTQVVWRKGENRQKNIWERHNDRLKADGSSSHTHALETDQVPQGQQTRRRRSTRQFVA